MPEKTEIQVQAGEPRKTIHFVSGLPRSGSTIFCNVAAQNPRFHATATSGVLEILFTARNRFCELQQFQAMHEEDLDRKSVQMLRGILFGYYGDVEKPVILEKSRSWESFAEMAEEILGHKPKIVCCVRDVRAVLASFEKLWRKTSSTRQLPDEKFNANNSQAFWNAKTVEGRCISLLQPNGGVVGTAITSITEAINRGWRKSIHFLDYDELCTEPKKTMRNLYDFLEEDFFDHNFDHIEQVTYENDLVWVYKNLHKIRPKLEEPEPEPWKRVIPEELIDRLMINGKPLKTNSRFWEDLIRPVPTIRRKAEMGERE
jgi:sulfotransferase